MYMSYVYVDCNYVYDYLDLLICLRIEIYVCMCTWIYIHMYT
jgi:hypothetical protein